MRYRIVTVLTVLTSSITSLDAQAPSEASQIAAKAALQRTSIKQFHASISLTLENPTAAIPKKKLHFEIWQTPERYRVDLTKLIEDNINSSDGGKTLRHVICDNCERPGWLVTGNDGQLVLRLKQPVPPPGKAHPEILEGIDPRLLGVTLNSYPNLITSPEPKWPTIHHILEDPEYPSYQMVMDDNQVRLTSTNSRSKSELAVWIDPALGHNITKLESKRLDQATGKVYTASIKCSGYQKISDNLYYPTRIEDVRKVDDIVRLNETYNIQVRSCNINIDPKVFMVAGMGFNNGKSAVVDDELRKSHVVWNGQIVAYESLTQEEKDKISMSR